MGRNMRNIQTFPGLLCVFVIVLWTSTINAGTFVVFGPQEYVREDGMPVTVPSDFSVRNPNVPYFIQVHNGGLDDGALEPVSSSIFSLNGMEILGPQEFSQTVSLIEKPVSLLSQNSLGIELRGKPGGTVVVQVLGTDEDLPTIQAHVSPSPNAAGWHNTDVTVTFTCQDATSGIASCPTPVHVTTDGAGQVVGGTATDLAGNMASTSVTINLDKTAPLVTITQPVDQGTVTALTVNVEGTANDSGSGVEQVLCNGSAASVVGSTFSCEVTFDGLDLFPKIMASATDLAGNARESTIQVALDTSSGNKVVAEVTNEGGLVSIPGKAALGIPAGSVENTTVEISLVDLPSLPQIADDTLSPGATLLPAPPVRIRTSAPFTEPVQLEISLPDLQSHIPLENEVAVASVGLQGGVEGEGINVLATIGGSLCRNFETVCVTLIPARFGGLNSLSSGELATTLSAPQLSANNLLDSTDDQEVIVVLISKLRSEGANELFDFTPETLGPIEDPFGDIDLLGTFKFKPFSLPVLPLSRIVVTSHMQKWRVSSQRKHTGVDLGTLDDSDNPTVGLNVMAAAEGLVMFARGSGGYGNQIRLLHRNNFSNFETWYAHLQSCKVEEIGPPQLVSAGQVIGLSGTSQERRSECDAPATSLDPHLHFEVKFRDRFIDPMPLLSTAENITYFGGTHHFGTRPQQTTDNAPAAKDETILYLKLGTIDEKVLEPVTISKVEVPAKDEPLQFSARVNPQEQLTQLGFDLNDPNLPRFSYQLKLCAFRLGECWDLHEWVVNVREFLIDLDFNDGRFPSNPLDPLEEPFGIVLPNGVQESDIYSVSGGLLRQRSIEAFGQEPPLNPFGMGGFYKRSLAVDTTRLVKVEVDVTAHKIDGPFWCGIYFNIGNFSICLELTDPDLVSGPSDPFGKKDQFLDGVLVFNAPNGAGPKPQLPFNPRGRHRYNLDLNPVDNTYKLFMDGQLIDEGNGQNPFTFTRFQFGDLNLGGMSGENDNRAMGNADWHSIRVWQP